MMRLITAAICSVLVSTSAFAQSTTTTCNWVGATVFCNSNTPQQQQQSTVPWGEYMRQNNQYWQQQNAKTNRMFETMRRQKVGAMVAAGQCDQARATALNAGDLALARDVDSTCQPRR